MLFISCLKPPAEREFWKEGNVGEYGGPLPRTCLTPLALEPVVSKSVGSGGGPADFKGAEELPPDCQKGVAAEKEQELEKEEKESVDSERDLETLCGSDPFRSTSSRCKAPKRPKQTHGVWDGPETQESSKEGRELSLENW